MKAVYEYRDYRRFLNTWIEEQPGKGRGIKGKLAEAAGVSPSLISQVLTGEKELSLEQAEDFVHFMALSEREADHFILLVEYGRAGSHKLKTRLEKRVRDAEEKAKKISERVSKDTELTEEVKAVFYSSWIYTAICNLVALPKASDAKNLSERLQLPQEEVLRALEFLLDHRMLLREKGRLIPGPSNTHVGVDSPFVNLHHKNWRTRGIVNMERRAPKDLFYTCPMSLSPEAAEEVRKRLLALIDQVLAVVRPAPSEQVNCLNIDWFEF